MLSLALPYLSSVVTLVAGDLLWLGILARPFYVNHIGHLMAATPNWFAAGAFYLIYPLGLMLFVIQPNLATSPLRIALLSAAYGFFAYALYDLTNHATLKNWPLAITLTDVAWGTFLTTLMGLAAYFVAQYFLR